MAVDNWREHLAGTELESSLRGPVRRHLFAAGPPQTRRTSAGKEAHEHPNVFRAFTDR
jgi:hypothetical protein